MAYVGTALLLLFASRLAGQAAPPLVRVTAERIAALPEWNIGAPTLRIGEGDGVAFHLAGLPVRLGDGRIVVPNERKELRYFDSRGRLLRTVGRQGQGPGDFRQLWSVLPLDRDSILAFDASGPYHRVSIFSPSGDFVRYFVVDTMIAGAMGFGRLPNGSFAYSRYDESRRRIAQRDWRTTDQVRDTFPLVLRRPDGRTEVLLQLPSSVFIVLGPTTGTSPLPGGANVIAAGRGGIVAGPADSGSLHWFDETGMLIRLVNLDLPRVPVSEALKQRLTKIREDGLRGSRERPISGPRFNEFMPVVQRVRLDRSGRLWVRRWALEDEATAEWIVFSADAKPTARVKLPQTFFFDDADTGWILGRYADRDGVQSIRMYNLPR